MQSIVCSQPGSLELVVRPAPSRGEDEVLVRVRRVGICGTDYHIYEGSHPFLAYPRVMGHELGVEVVEAPKGSSLRPGENAIVIPYIACGHCVACRHGKPNCCMNIAVLGVHRDGGMCQTMSIPAVNVIASQGLSADACATVEFLAIGAHAVRRGAVAKGDRVLVTGAGPIGMGAALFAKIAGADVVFMDRDVPRIEAANAACGLKGGIEANGNAAAAIAAYTDGDGFDVVFDATGNSKAMEAGFLSVAHGGRYVLVSVVRDNITFSDPEFHKREMTLLGSRNATAEDFQHVIDSIKSGQVPVDRLITHRSSLADVPVNLPKWATEKTGLIKAIIEIA